MKRWEKERERPKIPLSTHIRTNAKMKIKPLWANQLCELHKIISSFKIILEKEYQSLDDNLCNHMMKVKKTMLLQNSFNTWPLSGSWPFQNTYVCITSAPPSLLLAIKPGHIWQLLWNIPRINRIHVTK